MIETIYIDVQGERASRYVMLIEKLAQAERAKHVHESMTRRVLRLHDKRIQETRAELEKEGERLRSMLRAATK